MCPGPRSKMRKRNSIVWLLGPFHLLTTRDLKEMHKPKRDRVTVKQHLENLYARLVRLEPLQEATASWEDASR